MALGDIGIFSALKTKMQWHQSRQRVLAENVANADTPGYRAKDLRKINFASALASATSPSVGVARTNAKHIEGTALPSNGPFRNDNAKGWETTPSGNGVILEEQMMKVTENQMEYQSAASLYSKSVTLLKIALGANT